MIIACIPGGRDPDRVHRKREAREEATLVRVN